VVVRAILEHNRDISRKEAAKLARLIKKTATRHGVDPLLVTALVSQESAFYSDAVSPVGAIGLGQLMPGTAADLGVDPHDPAENLEGSVRYLSQNLETWSTSANPVAYALASYNAGPGSVKYYGGIPPYQETQHYVEIITRRYKKLRQRALALRANQKQKA
jgi:soluble lytic murein transglycosylase-like protein